jgi:hypothetical protein
MPQGAEDATGEPGGTDDQDCAGEREGVFLAKKTIFL